MGAHGLLPGVERSGEHPGRLCLPLQSINGCRDEFLGRKSQSDALTRGHPALFERGSILIFIGPIAAGRLLGCDEPRCRAVFECTEPGPAPRLHSQSPGEDSSWIMDSIRLARVSARLAL